MRKLLVFILVLALIPFPHREGFSFGRCTGSPYCRVCSDCSRCGHCNSGGSCGVCGGGSYSSPTKRNSGYSSPSTGRSIGSSNSGYSIYKFKTVSSNKANVRLGPGLAYTIIGTFSKGARVDVVELTGDWYKILYEGRYYFMHKSVFR